MIVVQEEHCFVNIEHYRRRPLFVNIDHCTLVAFVNTEHCRGIVVVNIEH
jgi:hypothetical protein